MGTLKNFLNTIKNGFNELFLGHPNLGNVDNLTDIELNGVDHKDYPDFADAYITSAVWATTGKELTEDELDELNSLHVDLINELAHESVI